MTPNTRDMTSLYELDAVLGPDDAAYESACQAWNLAVLQRPAAVGVPETVDDVARIARVASELGLRVAPQSTGHGAGALGDVVFDDVVLLRMNRLTGVQIDSEARTARILGGTHWREVIEAAAPCGLTALHGSAGDVAVVGYLLGGGLSFYGRAHGLAAGSLRAVELVTPTGDRIRADVHENTDLLWAVRGGGGNFGVVVAVEIDLLPISDVVAGMMLWDMEHAPTVLRTWTEWTATAPESATTSLRLMRFPPLPELPPFLSGRSLVVIDGAVLEDDVRAAEILQPLRALSPEMDTFTRVPAEKVLDIHMDPPDPMPGVSDHAMIATLPEDALAALLAVAGPGVDTPLLFLELRHIGGALGRSHDGAVAGLDGEYALLAMCVVPVPEILAPCEGVVRHVVEAMRPWATERLFGNFCDRPSDARAMFDAPDWERLNRIRDRHDGERRWVAAHAVGGR